MSSVQKHVVLLSYHFPTPGEPGAFRPWMEARLLEQAGYRVTVVTSGVHYMTGEDVREQRRCCSEEYIGQIRVLKTWCVRHHRKSMIRRVLNYFSFTLLAFFVTLFKTRRTHALLCGSTPIMILPVAYICAKLKRCDFLIDERDLYPETAIALEVVREGMLTKMLFSMQEFLRKRTTGILAATPGIRSVLVGYGHPADRIKVIPNADAYLTQEIEDETDSAPDLHNRFQCDLLVGYCGSLGRANDLSTILRAAKRVQDLNHIHFVIIGAGEQRARYEQYLADEKMENVTFYGAVPRSEARHLIKQFDIGVHALVKCDHFHTALSSKIFDYHALGVPLMYCGIGDVIDLLEETRGGFGFPAGDDELLASRIRWASDHPEQLKQMGRSAQTWFETNVTPERYCEVLTHLIERTPHSTPIPAIERDTQKKAA